MRNLKQLIELAELKEKDAASLDEAIEIYELIINEYDYSHWSINAGEALDRIKKVKTHPTSQPIRIFKREVSLAERILFRLAIACYVASLVLPVDGLFFAGVIMFVLSVIGSLYVFPEVVSQIPTDPGAALGLILVLMPFYNVVFLIALTRFWETGRSRFSIFRICLYSCTAVSLVWSAMALTTQMDRFYVSGLWAAAFLFLSLAVAVCTEKNLTGWRKSSARK